MTGDPTLRASKGDIHNGAFPRHPGGPGFYFIYRHIGMKSDSPFGRPASSAVLNAISIETENLPIVHPNRKHHRKHPFWVLDHVPHICRKVKCVGSEVEVLDRCFIGVLFGNNCD
jgi:hypothetical protein